MTPVDEQSSTNTSDSSDVNAISQNFDSLHSKEWRILHNVLKFFLHEIFHSQKMFIGDKGTRKLFIIMFLAETRIDFTAVKKLAYLC